MKLEKKYLAIAVIAAVLALPVAFALSQRSNQINIEKSEKAGLQYQLDTKQELLEKKEQEVKKQQQKNNELKKQLQAKKEAKQKIAQAVTPPVSVSASGSSAGNCEAYRPLVAKYDWDVKTAMAIMRAESGCNKTAASPTNDHGLFQINQGLGLYGQKIYDPAFNVEVAYFQKYKQGGWSHWTVYNTGAYLQYLS